ncbi:flagellar biosynthesis/type III secretory pathway chaperone [Anaerosolibacter carboniphilus]|uniref:Flagellar biosynthesis/type III secretory pathway chaperone n=1 Tax=Anaerosolibacter carboniphilus TaxID=1417629 RepID=A0A841KWM3_9FIRM|nr:flagellar protein FlgN [Anaerosolibacter carboniphilus]MBB6216410.1 flagellar biosynthesis/type III secretory pathway chaperone [Anaerosolibacter carboniphilus]
MSKSIEQLITVLKEECNLYKDYLDLAREKKTAVIKGEIKELDHITKREQNMIVNMGKVDQIRTAIIGNILLEKNIASVETISELADLIEEPARATILKLKDNLAALLEETKNLNHINSELLQQALEYVDYNINLLTSAQPQSSTYGNKADEKDLKARANIFDAKI